MRIVLTGGGTGGHIYPAVAIGKQMQRHMEDTSLLYIGTSSGLESRIVPSLDIPFEAIHITGFKRKLSLENAKTIVRFFRGVSRSKQLLRKFKPDVVVGTGGYVCGPVVYAASKLGIPTLIHEQNVIPGLTNKFLSRYANAVAVSFENSSQHFKSSARVLYTGNPCATQVLNADRKLGFSSLGLEQDSRFVLIVGGSRGARAINDAVLEMTTLMNRLQDVTYVFVTGEAYYEQTSKRISQLHPGAAHPLKVVPYVHNMPQVLAAATLVVSRSGASSLAELTALGVPSILIPSPNVTNNHQEPNARSLSDAGASEMMLERELTGSSLFDKIREIMGDEARLIRMRQAALALGMPQSADLIVNELVRLRSNR